MPDNGSDGQITLSLAVKKTLSLIQSQLNAIAKSLKLVITGQLNVSKTQAQINRDLKSVKPSNVKLTGKLNRTDTKKQLAADVKSLDGKTTVKIKAKIDKGELDKQLKTNNVKLDVEADADDLKDVGDGLDTINRKSAATVASITLLNQSLHMLERAARKMIETAADLDKQLTDLRLVTGQDYDEASRLVDSYNALAKELGATTSQVTAAANEWLRQGKSISETEELITQSMILSKVGAMDSTTATENLTSAMKGYGLAVDDVAGIVDKLTAIDLQAAVTSSGLAVAMSKTAASANIAGVSMDRLLGYIATVMETTQKTGEVVGESLKTMFARMNNVKLGNFIDDDGEAINDTERILHEFGIELRDVNDEFRSEMEVLDELAGKWTTFSSLEKSAIAVATAGTRQRENFLVLMENYGKALEYSGVAAQSAGTALEKFSAYQDSLEAHFNTMTASAEALAKQTVPVEFLKGLTDAGSAILDFATQTNVLAIALNSLGAALAVKGISAFVGKIKNVYQNVTKLSSAFKILDQSADVELSEEEFSKLLSVTKGLNAQELKLIVTNKNLTTQQRMAILTANGMTEAEAAETLATLGLSTAEGAATTATFSLSGAFKALTAAIASNPIGFLVVALTAAVSVISTVTRNMEEARQAVIDAGTEAAEHGEKITTLVDAYLELSAAVDAGTGSREDLMAAQADLLVALGLEGQGVDELVAKYGSLKQAILEASMASLETDISVALSGSKAAKEKAISELETYLGTSINAGTDGAEILQYLQDQGFTGISIGTKSGTMSLPNLDIWDAFSNPTIEELLENRKFLQDAMNAVRTNFGTDSQLFESLAENYTRYDTALKPVIEAIDKSNNLIAQYYIQAAKAVNDPKTKAEFDAFKAAIIDNLQNDYDFDENGSFSAAGLVDSILSTDRLFAQFYADVDHTLDELESSVKSHSESIKGTLEKLWNSDSFEDTKKKIISLANSLDGINATNIDDLVSSSTELKAILDQDGMSAQFLAHILQQEATEGNGFNLITESALELNQALEGLRGQFDEVTAAKSRYDAAMSVKEKDTDFKSYAAAFKELNAQFVAGTTNSNAFWAAAEYLFGADQLNAWGWSDGLENIYAAMQQNVGIFKDADSAGAGFLDRLYEISRNGTITADDGSIIATIEKLADGNYDFQFETKDIDVLADKLGITKESALACMQALSMYGDFQFYDIDTVMQTIHDIGLASDSINGTAVNVGTLTDQLISLGYTNKDIHDLLTVLQSVDGVTLLNADANVQTLTQNLLDLGLAAQDGVEIKINADALGDLMAQLSFSKEDTQNLITKLGEADGITLTNAEGEVIDLDTALRNLDDIAFASVTSELDGITTAADLATQSVETLQTTINNLKGKEITVTVNYERRGAILDEYATGTQNAPETDALVGEDGTELVQSKNRAYLVGANGPEIVHLNEGDKVYTAEQTRRITRGSIFVHGVIPAYAGGRINTGGRNGEGWKSVLDGSTKTGSGTMTDGTDEAQDSFEKLYKYHQHLLAMDQESVEDYLKWLNAAYKEAYENGEITLDDYYKYEEEVFSKVKASLDDVRKEHENAITLLQRSLDTAIAKGNYQGITEYTGQIIDHYRAMQDEVHKQAEYYRSLGYSETSDEITKLKTLWWEYYDEIRDVSAKAWQQVVDNANEAVDSIQNVYDTLKEAAQEYAESGFITIDTLQKILDLGVENLAYLQDENGNLVINEERIQAVIAARTQQMAIETALNYVQQIRQALTDNDTEALNRLLFATEATTQSTWDLVYAQLAALNLDSDQYNAALQRINAIRSLTEVAVTSICKVDGARKKALEDTKSALDDILKYVEEMIKQEVQNQIDALEKQIDDFKKIVDLQKESLELERKKEEHTKSIAKKTKELAKIQEELALLELDTSRESQAKQIKLREQMADIQEELTDEQNDYARDTTSDALDDMASDYEESKKKEIKILEDTISSEEKLYQLAIARIDSNWEGLYDDLIKWNTQYGNVINDDLTAAWNAASGAVQSYGGYLSAVLAIQNQLDSIDSGSANSFPSTNTNVGNKNTESKAKDIVKQMKANSAAWSGADEKKRQELADANAELAKEFEKLTGMKLVRGSDGVWYINKVGGSKLYEKYHSGGIVGDQGTLQQNEVFAKLEKGEIVLNRGQQDELFRRLEFEDTMLGRYGNLFEKFSGNNLPMMKQMEAAGRGTMPNVTYDNRVMDNSVKVTFGDNNFYGAPEETFMEFQKKFDKHLEWNLRHSWHLIKR